MNFNKNPYIRLDHPASKCVESWPAIGKELSGFLENRNEENPLVLVETYQGVLYDELMKEFVSLLNPVTLIDTRKLFKTEADIREMTQPDVTDDRVFGFITSLQMEDFLDGEKLTHARKVIGERPAGLTLVFGFGASLLSLSPSLIIYADMARWEIQLRMRQNLVNNLGINNADENHELKYKRGFFVDWRVCDRLKKQNMDRWDYILDSNQKENPKLAEAKAVFRALEQSSRQPFSLVPFFDPGPWGGQWMKEKFVLGREAENYAWCFNCVPEENSLVFIINGIAFEIPAINLVFYRPKELLGEKVFKRFGTEFPIRFDFLDTMEGGNLSLQVHPMTSYIRENFGMEYTQDESYYLMETGEGASVYLGLKEGIDREKMISELRIAEKEGNTFKPEKYIENWPAKKHDHFLIPAGTVHCSGKNGMVLEISATPYIFTFKLYDWGRKNLDGKPRPINVSHGLNNIQWDRDTNWVKENLINRIETLDEGEGWKEEKTGLHEMEFIETRRHWFNKKVEHDTMDNLNVLNLVEGEEIIVESPEGKFQPFLVNYAETFVVPAATGKYTIKPWGKSLGKTCATIKAFVRT